MRTIPAIAVHHTPTVDRPWDGPAAVAAAPNDGAVLRHMAAWRDPNGDPDVKATFKEWHHGPTANAPANLSACRAVLANLGGARTPPDIPTGDREGVAAHVQAHLDDAQQ